MEDQIITPKAKFDRMEQELKELRSKVNDEKEKNYINIDLELCYETQRGLFGENYKTSKFNFRIKKSESLPEDLNNKIEAFVNVLESRKKRFKRC